MYNKLDTHKFNTLLNGKSKIYTKYFVILYAAAPIYSFGFIASKKVGNAVIRNKSKRYLREIITKNSTSFPNKDFIIICKKNVGTSINKESFFQFEKDLLSGIKKIHSK